VIGLRNKLANVAYLGRGTPEVFKIETCMWVIHGAQRGDPWSAVNGTLAISSKQQFEYYSANAELYMASYDSSLACTRLLFGRFGESTDVAIWIVKYAFAPCETNWESTQLAVGLHAGGLALGSRSLSSLGRVMHGAAGGTAARDRDDPDWRRGDDQGAQGRVDTPVCGHHAQR
jgi:hypothetical protein